MTAAPRVFDRIAELSIATDRPLIVTDADEVLFLFMAAFERHLEDNGHYFDWSSFALDGNIRRHGDDAVADRDAVMALLNRFFDTRTGTLEPVPGASEALAALSRRAQVVVLSNVPWDRRAERRRALVHHGMDYPLIANVGPKGPAVGALARRVEAPVFFIDDGPNHHGSVAVHARAVRRVHMIADRRLAVLVGPAPDSHHRIDDWPGARAAIEAELTAAGY